MLNLEKKEKVRPGFKGKYKRDIASSEMNTLYYPNAYRRYKQMLGVFISVMMILLSCAFTLMNLSFKQWLLEREPESMLPWTLPQAINFFIAKIFAAVYHKVSRALNTYGNHKSISQFENSLIFKVFISTHS
jgi:uncharacterized membrane protein